MKTRLLIFVIGLVVIFAAGGAVYYYKFYRTAPPVSNENQNVPVSVIKNFDDCVAAGNPVMESYPRQCSANGQTFTENIGNALEKKDLIVLTLPQPNTIVTSPLELTGEARGNWYFEASFPVKLLDADGNVLAQIPAQAQGDWMTENFVPFKTTLEFTAPATDTGTLVLEKDNPSGLPEHADSLIVPVKFR